MTRRRVWSLFLIACFCSAARGGEVEIRVVDSASGEPTAARMHLKNQYGKPVLARGVPGWSDHFVFNDSVVLKLPSGRYTFEMERGPEYKLRTGHFIIERGATDNKQVEMVRFVDMKKEGWYSGDLHIHRDPRDIPLLMLAEDLQIAPVITWWNEQNRWEKEPLPENRLVKLESGRFYHLLAGEDERAGGALLFFNLAKPLPIAGAEREYPCAVKFLRQAKLTAGAHVDAEKPFWWDMPLWIATGQVDSIGLLNNHQQRNGVLNNEAWGKPRDKLLFPDPYGNGRWSQEIYYHLLNCGLRMPPSAGSASGVLANPVGYNRVYVYCGDDFTWERWWQGLKEGKVVVTNGPLLRPFVNGKPPGHVFSAAKDETVSLEVTLNLSTRDPIDYLEIVKNGKVVHEVRLEDWAKAGGKLPLVEFSESGWLLVRAVTNYPASYRLASSGPYYVEIGYQPRISKASAQFFLDWVFERARQLKIEDPDQKAEVLADHRTARDFWQNLLDKANTD